MSQKEIWKDLDLTRFGKEDYTGIYQISNKGRVRSLERVISYKFGNGSARRDIKASFLTPNLNTWGYPYVGLWKGEKRVYHTVHRLVGYMFLPLPEDWDYIEKTQYHGYTINHKDSDKVNNDINNLEWVTMAENMTHSQKVGTAHHKRKPVVVYNDRCLLMFDSINKAATTLGLYRESLSMVLGGKHNSTGGWRAEFL